MKIMDFKWNDILGHVLFRYLAGVVFLVSGIAKFIDPLPAMKHMGITFELLSDAAAHNIVLGAASTEVLLGFGMLSNGCSKDVLVAGRLVAVLLAAAVVYDASRGRTAGCGCFGAKTVLDSFPTRVMAVSIILVGTAPRVARRGVSRIGCVIVLAGLGRNAGAQDWADYLQATRQREALLREHVIQYVEAAYLADGAAFRVEYVRSRLAPPAEKWVRVVSSESMVRTWPPFRKPCDDVWAFRAFEGAIPLRVQVYDGSRLLVIDRGKGKTKEEAIWTGRLTLGYDDAIRSGALNWWHLMWHQYPSHVLESAKKVYVRKGQNGAEFLVFFPRNDKSVLMLRISVLGPSLLPVHQVASVVSASALESLGERFVGGSSTRDPNESKFLYEFEVRKMENVGSISVPVSVSAMFSWAKENHYLAWFRYIPVTGSGTSEFDVRGVPEEVGAADKLLVRDELTGETRDWKTNTVVSGLDLGKTQHGVSEAREDEATENGFDTNLRFLIVVLILGAILLGVLKRLERSTGI